MTKLTHISLRIAEASADDGGDNSGGERRRTVGCRHRLLTATLSRRCRRPCVDLEPDIKRHDSLAPGAPAHICDALRALSCRGCASCACACRSCGR
jgi:hypothetical protein